MVARMSRGGETGGMREKKRATCERERITKTCGQMEPSVRRQGSLLTATGFSPLIIGWDLLAGTKTGAVA
eukprot:scaffold2767_cov177-Amphora_coffeaeformis.AAC.65